MLTRVQGDPVEGLPFNSTLSLLSDPERPMLLCFCPLRKSNTSSASVALSRDEGNAQGASVAKSGAECGDGEGTVAPLADIRE